MTQTLTEKEKTPLKLRHSILDAIGNTPLIKLTRMTRHLSKHVEIWAKLESKNPGGSGKDRPALQIVLDAFASKKMNNEKILIDASTGSIGVGYAMCGAAMGFNVSLVVPEGVEKNGLTQMTTAKILGAKIIRSEGSIEDARLLAEKTAQNDSGFYYANQFENPSNSRAHRLTTEKEIFHQTQGKITHFVSSVGTGGTLVGISEGLHERNPAIKVIACRPTESTQHESMQSNVRLPFTPDQTLTCSLVEAVEMANQLAEHEGIPGGIVAGMNLCAAFKIAQEMEEGLIVILVSDHADFTGNIDYQKIK